MKEETKPVFDNKERNRYYGKRVGDTVTVCDPSGRLWGVSEVLELCPMDNNKIMITSKKGNPIDWVAEWCDVIKKVEDKEIEKKQAEESEKTIKALLQQNIHNLSFIEWVESQRFNMFSDRRQEMYERISETKRVIKSATKK